MRPRLPLGRGGPPRRRARHQAADVHHLPAPDGEVDGRLSRLQVNLAFLGASGVDGVGGITTGSAAEAAVKARFLQVGRRRVLLAASSALGRVSPARFGSLGEVDLLITGRAAPPASVAGLRALGLAVTCA